MLGAKILVKIKLIYFYLLMINLKEREIVRFTLFSRGVDHSKYINQQPNLHYIKYFFQNKMSTRSSPKSPVAKSPSKYAFKLFKTFPKKHRKVWIFPVWLRNRLTSAGLELVLSYTEKSYIASYYRHFFTNVKIKIIKLKLVLLTRFFSFSLQKWFIFLNFLL